jgi:hypothetical protein
MTPFYGWKRYQSIYFIQVIGAWAIQTDASASAQQYRISSSARATARYPFTGDGMRLAYKANPQGCLFDLVVDATVVASIDSQADITEWCVAGPYFLSSGYHVLDVRSQAQEAGACALAFDYIEVFSNPPMPTGAAVLIGGVERLPSPIYHARMSHRLCLFLSHQLLFQQQQHGLRLLSV